MSGLTTPQVVVSLDGIDVVDQDLIYGRCYANAALNVMNHCCAPHQDGLVCLCKQDTDLAGG